MRCTLSDATVLSVWSPLLLALGCRPVEMAPASWPEQGCASAGLSGEVDGDREDRLWLEIEPELRLLVHARWPRGVDCHGAVVIAPPGFESGERMTTGDQGTQLVARGLAVISFDPRGRGESDGAEDSNGSLGQDDLAAVLRWVASQPEVDPDRVVLSSRSFGGALAAGALARHDDLRVLAWVDYESPGFLSQDLAYAPSSNQETFEALVPDDPELALAWWAEREPAGLIGGLIRPYHRYQGLPDHALGDHTGHAADMLSSAVAAPELWYNGARVYADEIVPSEVRDDAIEGGIEPEGQDLTQAILDLFG